MEFEDVVQRRSDGHVQERPSRDRTRCARMDGHRDLRAGVRLDEAASKELAVIDGSGPFGPAERPMGGYLSLPAAWRASPGLAAGWVERALSHVSALPPKARKARKP